jgi:hypothetical protein
MAKKSKSDEKSESSLPTNSRVWALKFKVGDSIEKLAPRSDNYGLIGIIISKEISPGGYHFCWVRWGNKLSPEHYNCIKKVVKL